MKLTRKTKLEDRLAKRVVHLTRVARILREHHFIGNLYYIIGDSYEPMCSCQKKFGAFEYAEDAVDDWIEHVLQEIVTL